MNQNQDISLLRRLRSLIPQRLDITFDEALRIAELQAACLVEIAHGPHALDEHNLAQLRRFRVVHEYINVSGMSHWTGTEWLITLNASDSRARQRFTLLHEYKHIIDHGSVQRLYCGSRRATAAEQAERAADYFAGCALVPKRELKAAWGGGMQRVPELAAHFGVSPVAIAVRLAQTKLTVYSDEARTKRCDRPAGPPPSGPPYFRTSRPRSERSYA